jgi:hypothetical protein
MLLADIRIHRAGLPRVLQVFHPAPGWRSLRPLHLPEFPTLCVAISPDPVPADAVPLYALPDLLDYYLAESPSPLAELPEPLPPSATLSVLPTSARRLLFAAAMGLPKEEVLALAGGTEERAQAEASWQAAGVYPVRPSTVEDYVAQAEARRTHAIARENPPPEPTVPTNPTPTPAGSELTATPAPVIARPGSLRAIAALLPTEGDYLVPEPISEALAEQIRIRMARNTGKRRSWPFKDMQPLERVRIAPEDEAAAQRAAHAVAASRKWVFRSMRGPDAQLTIIRLK